VPVGPVRSPSADLGPLRISLTRRTPANYVSSDLTIRTTDFDAAEVTTDLSFT
jgi:hypothetical protein